MLLGAATSSVDAQIASPDDATSAESFEGDFDVPSEPENADTSERASGSTPGVEQGLLGDSSFSVIPVTDGKADTTGRRYGNATDFQPGVEPGTSGAAALGSTASGAIPATATLAPAPNEPGQRHMALPAAGTARPNSEGFDFAPVYLLFAGVVLVGFVMNGLVGGVRRSWNS